MAKPFRARRGDGCQTRGLEAEVVNYPRTAEKRGYMLPDRVGKEA